MDRFQRDGLNNRSALLAVVSVLVALLVASLITGASVRRAGEREPAGVTRTVLLLVGAPTEAIEEATPIGEWWDDLTENVTGRASIRDGSGAERQGSGSASGEGGGLSLESIDPAFVEGETAQPRRLQTVLVTGDSMAMPLDVELARELADAGVEVVRDPRPGSGISNAAVADWANVAQRQIAAEQPDAVIVFIGANEGYPFEVDGAQVECCTAAWTLAYAQSAAALMRTWGRDGEARVYWLTLPTARDDSRRPVTLAVNHAVDVAAGTMRAFVERVDVGATLTPDDTYSDTAVLDGDERIVRNADGIHLNDAGSAWVAQQLEQQLEDDFEVG